MSIFPAQLEDFSRSAGWRADDMHPSDVECLRDYVNARTGPPDASGCKPWIGSVGYNGYGRICQRVNGRQTGWLAHRVAYVLATGESLTDDLTIDHLCFTPGCVNVADMEVVTLSENVRRARARQGYPLSDEDRRAAMACRQRDWIAAHPDRRDAKNAAQRRRVVCDRCGNGYSSNSLPLHVRRMHGREL